MAEETGFWGGIFDNLGKSWDYMKEHPEKTSIALDTLGSNLAPENPFAGIGTALGKSSLVSKAETASQEQSMDMFNRMLAAMTASKEKGLSSATFSLGDDGKLDYKLAGREEGLGGIGQPTKMPGVETPKILTEEDFASAFGEGGGY